MKAPVMNPPPNDTAASNQAWNFTFSCAVVKVTSEPQLTLSSDAKYHGNVTTMLVSNTSCLYTLALMTSEYFRHFAFN